jgi:hypothetical protein
MKESNQKPYFFALTIFIVFILIVIVLLFQSRFISFTYKPYVINHLLLVFTDSDKLNEKNNNLDFLLSDLRNFQGEDKNVGVVSFDYLNSKKNISAIAPYADTVYLDIFSNWGLNKSNLSYFYNNFGISSPFEIRSYISESTKLKIVYKKNEKRLDFVFLGQPLEVNGNLVKLNDVIVFSSGIVGPESLIKISDLIINLSDYNNDLFVSMDDLIKHGVKNYEFQEINSFKDYNFSFEQGFWSDQVGDCSAYLSGSPEISMSLRNSATDGNTSLELSSSNHFACTLKSFPVSLDASKLYKLAFDYKNVEGQTVQYYYNLRNDLDQVQEKFDSFSAKNSEWNTFETIIDLQIQNPKELSLYFYAPSDGSRKITNLYDNVNFYSYELVGEFFLPKFEFPKNYGLFNWVSLKDGENTFRYVNYPDSFLKDYNFSFEQGFWEGEVSDCSNYLSRSPEISMSLRNSATDGDTSLELSSSNHFACTLKSFPVSLDASKLYKLAFDYKNVEGQTVQYYYNLRNDLDQIQEKFDSFSAKNSEWNTFETIIDLQIQNPKELSLYFYAPSDGSRKITNLYDNVRILEVAPKEIYSYYLVSKLAEKPSGSSGEIKSLMVNNWKTKVTLNKTTGPLMVVYPKNFSERWKIFPADGHSRLFGFFDKRIAKDNHFRINNHVNGWLIDTDSLCKIKNLCRNNNDGSYSIDLIIEHDFNRLFNLGLIIFGIVIMISGYYFIKIKNVSNN